MGSLFADEGETIAQFDNRLMAAQQHRDQLRIINALNAYSVDDSGTPRAVWRISK
jgi:predicted Zn-dependent protease